MPDIFFPENGNDAEAIAGYCLGCPVKKECGDKADRIKAESGVWGGERRRGK